MKKTIIVSFFLFAIANLSYASEPRQIQMEGFLEGGASLNITVIAPENDEKIKILLSKIMESSKSLDSVIRKDIGNLKTEPVQVNPATIEFLNEAINLSKITDGWFDITNPSEKTWFIKKDYRRIETIDTPPTVTLKSSGIKFDLDLLLPAFIVEAISNTLMENGYLNGFVAIGNVQKGFGNDLYTPWTLNVPKQEISASKAYIANNYGIRNAGWVTLTSGTSLIDAKSKKPVLPWYINMTVLSTKTTTAVAFAYTIASLGPKVGLEHMQKHNEIEAVITTPKGELFATKAFKLASPFQFNELKGNHGSNDLKQKQREEEKEIGK